MADYFELPDELHVYYRYSYGGLSPFFRALVEDQRILGTRCPQCGKVYCPPRTHCGACYAETTWVPLDGKGTVIAAVYCYWTPADWPARPYIDLPYVYALVRLDGADTCLNSAVVVDDMRLNERVRQGTRVRAVFREKREGKITDFYFVPDEG